MYRVRGKASNGDSITGTSGRDSVAAVAKEVEDAAESAGHEVVRLTIMTLDDGAGLKIAAPRKRDGEKKGKGKK